MYVRDRQKIVQQAIVSLSRGRCTFGEDDWRFRAEEKLLFVQGREISSTSGTVMLRFIWDTKRVVVIVK